jgi:cell division protein FtsN
MTRDYKPASRNKKTPSSGSGSSLLVGILIGLLLGLAIALAVAIYLNKIPGPFLSRSRSSEPTPAAKAEKSEAAKSSSAAKAPESPSRVEPKEEEKPRFDFYNILPGTDEGAKSKPAPPQSSSATEPKEIFYLQAGAFQNAADADNLKARLALMGIEATIQAGSSGDRGTFHRVRIGPFTRVDEVNRTRDTLKQNGIESTLIKGREKAN